MYKEWTASIMGHGRSTAVCVLLLCCSSVHELKSGLLWSLCCEQSTGSAWGLAPCFRRGSSQSLVTAWWSSMNRFAWSTHGVLVRWAI